MFHFAQMQSVFASTSSSRQPLICFLSLQYCLFYKFHVKKNHIICSHFFLVSSPSKIWRGDTIHVVACISNFPSIEWYSIVCIHYLMGKIHWLLDGHLYCFQFLNIISNTAMNMHVQVFELLMFKFLLGGYLRLRLLDYILSLYLTF